VDVDQALADVRDKVSSVEAQLPSGVDPPLVQKFDIGAAPVLSVALSSDVGPRELSRIAKDEVKPILEQVEGVGGADLLGAREREFKVLVDPAKLMG
jgi:HAE1 family hydrophobic/amphiphilic exporter-1